MYDTLAIMGNPGFMGDHHQSNILFPVQTGEDFPFKIFEPQGENPAWINSLS